MGLKWKLGIIVVAALFFLMPAKAHAATVTDITKEVICQCGCTLVLANCTHNECISKDTMTTFIGQQLAQDKSGEQIIQLFVSQYGEQVLASPPKQGFNLMAWVTPFVAILAGGGIVYLAIKKWLKRGQQSRGYVVPGEEDDKYRRQLEEELKHFTERSFR